jgi:hypothetical protein
MMPDQQTAKDGVAHLGGGGSHGYRGVMSGDGETTASGPGWNQVVVATGVIGGIVGILLGLNSLVGWNPLNKMFPNAAGTASPTPLGALQPPPSGTTNIRNPPAPAPDRTGCKDAFRILDAPVPELKDDMGPVHAYAAQQAAQLRIIARQASNPAVITAVQAYATDWDSLGSAVQDYEEARRQAERLVSEAERYTESFQKYDKQIAEFNRQQRYHESRGDTRNATIAYNNAVAAYGSSQAARNQSSALLQRASEATARKETASQRMDAAFDKLRADVGALNIACD